MSTPALAADWLSALEPPPNLKVSEWAEKYRMLPEASAARGGKWANETAPYLVGIMDAAREPGVRKIAVMKGVQTGGSEALNNIIGYHIHHDPCPMLVIHPAVDVAEQYSKERLSDMIRSTPELAAVVRDKAQPRTVAQQSESTLTMKMFPGGFIILGGANSPNPFARSSVRIGLGDDVDRWPAVVGVEGDPVDLLSNRGTSFYDAVTIYVSTPTLKGGRIDTLYSMSDRRRYFVPCPHCGRWDWMTWNAPDHLRVSYEGEDADSARLECPSADHGGCGGQMLEPERRAMVARGEWRATAQAQEPGLAGFHLPAMVSTLGDVTLPGLVSKWLSARSRGKEALRVFINTSLAEGWEHRGATLDSHTLLNRREPYGEGVEVPAAVPCLTAGVDVQIDRYELQVVGWGLFGERWVVDTGVVPGNPKAPETQAGLLEALSRRYHHASGHWLPIHAVCIDSGWLPEHVYAFAARHRHRHFYATKGIGGKRGEPILLNAITKVPINVNADGAKADIMSSIGLVAPGPGYMHFPERVDEEYFAQLCSEHSETRKNKAGVVTEEIWIQDRTRNEALDTAVLALAAFRILAKGKENDFLRNMLAILASTPPAPGGDGQVPPPQAAPQPAGQQRRVGRSSYLGR